MPRLAAYSRVAEVSESGPNLWGVEPPFQELNERQGTPLKPHNRLVIELTAADIVNPLL